LTAALLAVAGLITTSVPASAVVYDPYFKVGKGAAPLYVYYTTYAGVRSPVYENSMPSWPSGKQFAGIKNAWGSNRFIVTEYRGVAGGYVYCARPGQIIWQDSSVEKSWVATHSSLGGCVAGTSYRIN
jgi:hypothetical protein